MRRRNIETGVLDGGRTRSRLSRTAASGKPTVWKWSSVVLIPEKSTSTSIMLASMPYTAALRALKSIVFSDKRLEYSICIDPDHEGSFLAASSEANFRHFYGHGKFQRTAMRFHRYLVRTELGPKPWIESERKLREGCKNETRHQSVKIRPREDEPF